MATYRIDPDLAFIGQCSNEDLGLLVSVLTHDSKDGKKRLAESLTTSPEYQLFYPDHQKYWPAICAELQAFGANSLVTLLRGNKGVLYREILLDVCSRMKVKHEKEDCTETAEINLLMQIMRTSISDMSPAALAALSQEMKLNLTNPTPQLVMMALQAAVNVSGVAALELASIASFGVIQAMGGNGNHSRYGRNGFCILRLPHSGHTGRSCRNCAELRMADSRYRRSRLPGHHSGLHHCGVSAPEGPGGLISVFRYSLFI
ncbi:DUF3944 domain-containing protein [Morganella morganii]|uniref:DUF3944 domain-containing protein n=3 Tax=Morganella morganii TaxID=582 RepID=UPI0030FE3F6E